MAKKTLKPLDTPPTSKRIGSQIGFKLNQDSRQTALETVDTITEQREKQGWLWVKKGSATKQIKPENLQKNLDNGWKVKTKL